MAELEARSSYAIPDSLHDTRLMKYRLNFWKKLTPARVAESKMEIYFTPM